jgi:nitrogen fixation protein FixH
MHLENPRSGFTVTGRMVLMGLFLFFAIVAGMNAVLIRAATSTFGGVETANAYQAGLAFNRDRAAALAQDGRHWMVTAELTRRTAEPTLHINLRDAAGLPVSAVAVAARISHPADARRDLGIELQERAPGQFEGAADVPPGQWDLLIDVARNGQNLFRSRSRIVLR